jgi:hypothetical protein
MRGYDNFNFPAFDAAAEYLRGFGHTVLSPAEHDRAAGFDETQESSLDGFDLGAAMAWDLEQVRECDFVVLLPGWVNSTGANRELEEAEKWGKGAYEYDKTGRIKFRYGTGNVVLEPKKVSSFQDLKYGDTFVIEQRKYDLTTPEETRRQALWQAQDDLMDVPMPQPPKFATADHQFADAPPYAETHPQIRTFDTGATRDTENGKLDYEGFISPWAWERYGRYMNEHRKMADGSLRASDNWQHGFPREVLLKSLFRHFMAVWMDHRMLGIDPEIWDEPGWQEAMENDLCGVLFNTQALLHQLTRPGGIL